MMEDGVSFSVPEAIKEAIADTRGMIRSENKRHGESIVISLQEYEGHVKNENLYHELRLEELMTVLAELTKRLEGLASEQ